MNFYQYNLGIWPTNLLSYAISYLMKIMNVLLQYNSASYNDLAKLIVKTATKTYGLKKQNLVMLEPDKIVEEMEGLVLHKSEE